MKRIFILTAILLSSPVFADAYLKLGDIEGEATESVAPGTELDDIGVAAPEADIKVEELNGDAQRTKGETTLGDVTVVRELDKSSTKAQGTGEHNSTRSNKTGPRDAASGLPTGKRQHGKVDPDDDGDSVPTKATDYNSSRSNRGESNE